MRFGIKLSFCGEASTWHRSAPWVGLMALGMREALAVNAPRLILDNAKGMFLADYLCGGGC